MRRKANITLRLFLLIPNALLLLLRNVVDKLTGNTHLPDTPVSLAEMAVLGDKLEQAIEDALQGSRLSREARDKWVDEVRSVLTRTANYVRTVANGDGEILASSGYPMARVPERIGVPNIPEGMNVRTGQSTGEILVRCKKTRGATSYKFMRAEKDPSTDTAWEVVAITSAARFADTGRESYKPYWYMVAAIGYAGESKPTQALVGRAS